MNAQEQPQETRPLRLKPIVSYPGQAEVGKTYLMSIDVQLAQENGKSDWPYPEEEYAISFVLNLQPYFSYTPLGEREPTIVLHRFGGTYGPAEYRLQAADHEIGPGRISITFVNGWGLPITHLNLACEVRREVQADPTRQLLLVALPRPTSVEPQPIAELPIKPGKKADEHHLTPELQHAVDLVREQLLQTGWRVQRETSIDWSGVQGVAVRDYPYSTDDIPTFMLHVDGAPVGLVDVRLPDDITEESGAQARARAGKLLSNNRTDLTTGVLAKMLPFVYEADGINTRYTSALEPLEARNRPIFTFHRPETLKRWLDDFPTHTKQMTENNLLRSRLRHLPEQPITIQDTLVREALNMLEMALAENQPRVLLRVAPGYDVSMLAIPGIYRLLKFGGARRILYLTGEAGEQRENAAGQRVTYIREQFARYIVPDEGRSLRRIYAIEGLSSLPLDPQIQVFIATMPQLAALLNTTPGQVAYRQDLPIETFDMIFVDDARLCVQPDFRGPGSYFDAPLVGFVNEENLEVANFFGGKVVYTLRTMLRPATVLILHTDEDTEDVAFLQRFLLLRGIHVLLDTYPVEAGTPWHETIARSIEEADTVLLITSSTLDSEIVRVLEKRYPEVSSLRGVVEFAQSTIKSDDRGYFIFSPKDAVFSHYNFSSGTLAAQTFPQNVLDDSYQRFSKELTSSALNGRQRVLNSTSANEIGIHFHTFPPTPPVGEHALDIDWSTYCADRWPTEEQWQQELYSALEDVRAALRDQAITTLRCYINARMSAAFLFGQLFSRQAGFTLLLIEQSNTWSTNATEITGSLIRTELEARAISAKAEAGREGESEHVATVEISISNSVTEDVLNYLDTHELACRYRLHVHLNAEAGKRPLEGANEALTLAWQVRRALDSLRKNQEITHFHLFCSLRHRLAVLLGHYLQGLDATITFYDFDTTERRYLAMYTLDSGK